MKPTSPIALAAMLLATACGSPTSQVDPALQARRVSMALRGVPPTAEETARARRDPASVDEMAAHWAADPAFAETVADWHGELLWLRQDGEAPLPPRGPLAGVDRGAIGRSVAEAPLRRVADLVLEDAPYSALFTGRTAMVDAVGAEIWGLPYDAERGGWQRAEFPPDHPSAGILADPSLWSRHLSSDTNHHRARANLVHRAWLCEDLSARTLELGDLDLSDLDGTADAVRSDPSCSGCHAVLDPLAASFAGFRRYILPSEVAAAYEGGCEDPDYCYPLGLFAPDAAPTAHAMGLPAAALSGRPVGDLAELGQALVEDPRFAPCVARQLAAYLGQQDIDEVPDDEVQRLATQFVDSGLDLKALALQVVLADRFAAAGGEVGPLIARPEQVGRTIEALTGFRWLADPDAGSCSELGCWGPVDLARDARWGFRDIGGGMDGTSSLRPVHQAQPLRHLAVARLAEEAAGYAVVQDAGLDPADRRLLRQIEQGDEDPDRVQAQLAALHEQLLGEPVAPTDVPGLYALWSGALAAGGSTERAWAAVIAAMLQSPELVLF